MRDMTTLINSFKALPTDYNADLSFRLLNPYFIWYLTIDLRLSFLMWYVQGSKHVGAAHIQKCDSKKFQFLRNGKTFYHYTAFEFDQEL